MAKRRRATPVTLTHGQCQRLERLWFIYGNNGPKTTPGNHSFIQGILEQGLDIRPLITKRSRKSEMPTPECEAAVDEVLTQRDASVESGRRVPGCVLRMVSRTTETKRPSHDPSWKAMLDDMQRHGHVAGGRSSKRDGTPDAA